MLCVCVCLCVFVLEEWCLCSRECPIEQEDKFVEAILATVVILCTFYPCWHSLTLQVTESTHPHFHAALKREALEKEQYSQRYPVLEKSVSLGNLPCSSVLVVTLDTASYVVNKESCHWVHCREGSHPLHSPGV